MKITTWNVNGIRSLKKSVPTVLSDLSSDIICFQETKISRSQLQENVALVDGYNSFFSYPRKQSGYSGVSTYCNDKFMPDHAQEDLFINDFIDNEDLNVCADSDYDSKIDFEGRVLLTEHYIKFGGKIGKVIVINVYCPRVDPEKPERHLYKMKFCKMLQSKMYQLCQQDCHVVIVGDLNIACSLIDHCDPGDEKEFKSSEARQWLNSFLSSEIQVNDEIIKPVDAFRHIYPDKKEAYTCWNTKTSARLTNYGTRIDYIIVSSSLLPILASCDILSDYQGSDHCPVSAKFNCECVPEINIRLPSICTRLWPEFAGQQQKLQAFFQKAQNIADLVTNSKESQVQLSKDNKISYKKNKQKSIKSFFTNSSSNNVPECKSECEVVYEDLNSKASSQRENPSKRSGNSDEWKFLLGGPPKPPLCSKHNKPCVLRTVKKAGPNMGRQFFMCAQPAGPASNPDANCNYFKWVTAPKINTLKNF